MKRTAGLAFLALLIGYSSLFAQPKIEWQKCLGGTGSDAGGQVVTTKDGGFIIAGSTSSSDGDRTDTIGKGDVWVVKLSSNGTIEWQKSFGGSNNDGANSIASTTDGGCIIAGWTTSSDKENGYHGNYDALVIKLDSSGKEQWERSYGGYDNDIAYSIIQSTDSCFVFCGQTSSKDGDLKQTDTIKNAWVVKISPTGSIIWQSRLGGSGSEYLNNIIQNKEGYYVAFGPTNSSDGDVTEYQGGFTDMWIVAVDSGKLLWQKDIGGPGDEFGGQILQTSDNGYIMCSTTSLSNSPFWNVYGKKGMLVMKLFSDLTIDWSWGYCGSYIEEGSFITAITDSTFYVGGRSSSPEMLDNHGSGDGWLLKIGRRGTMLAENCFGGSNNDWFQRVIRTPDNQYLALGITGSIDGNVAGFHGNPGSADIWVVKFKDETNAIVNPQVLSSPISVVNPISNNVHLTYIGTSSLAATISLLNLLGQTVLETTDNNTSIGERQVSLDVSSLVAGTYILKVKCGDEVVVRKVIKY